MYSTPYDIRTSGDKREEPVKGMGEECERNEKTYHFRLREENVFTAKHNNSIHRV